METLIFEIILSMLILTGSIQGSKALIQFMLTSKKLEIGKKDEKQSKNYFLVKIISGKMLFLLSIFILMAFRQQVNLLHVGIIYFLMLIAYSLYIAGLKYLKKNQI